MKGLDDRHEYTRGELTESSALANPLDQFKSWLAEAAASPDVVEPNAMTLSTVDVAFRPTSRVVLLRDIDETGGLIFFTNYDSGKGTDFVKNPAASLIFFWPSLERQVRINGTAARTSFAASDEYFAKRPRLSQLGAWASPQSKRLESRADLEARVLAVAEEYPDGTTIPRPENWGGYRVAGETWEFWQGRPNRLHDRLRYRRLHGKWAIERLAP